MKKNFTKFMQVKHGFTLVEILVAISVISVLSTIAYSIFSTALKNTRDNERIHDLKTVQRALEAYRHDNGGYPVTWNLPSSEVLISANKVYLNNIPRDKKSDQNYNYMGLSCTATSCGDYVVCAKKEGLGSFNSPGGCASLSCGISNCNIGFSSP